MKLNRIIANLILTLTLSSCVYFSKEHAIEEFKNCIIIDKLLTIYNDGTKVYQLKLKQPATEPNKYYQITTETITPYDFERYEIGDTIK